MRGFVIGLLLGLLIGAAGFWWLSQPPTGARGEAPVSGVDQLMQAKLDAFRLQADKVRQELEATGRVVRQEAAAFGKQVADAATDAGITTHIKAKLVADPKLSALDTAQAKPEQDVHVDDRQMFVEVARGLEIHGIHHQEIESTKKSLAELGPLVNQKHRMLGGLTGCGQL